MIGGLAALIALPHWYFVFGTTLMPELGGFAPITILILALVGGFIGCTFDSFLGATWQGMWFCRVCEKQTEKRTHCGEPADYLRGNRLLDNNMVNLLSGIVGALAAVLLYIFFLSIGLV